MLCCRECSLTRLHAVLPPQLHSPLLWRRLAHASLTASSHLICPARAACACCAERTHARVAWCQFGRRRPSPPVPGPTRSMLTCCAHARPPPQVEFMVPPPSGEGKEIKVLAHLVSSAWQPLALRHCWQILSQAHEPGRMKLLGAWARDGVGTHRGRREGASKGRNCAMQCPAALPGLPAGHPCNCLCWARPTGRAKTSWRRSELAPAARP